ncbi:MAG: hypothetical protein AAGJ38_04135 [Planctomycetota bacterium]
MRNGQGVARFWSWLTAALAFSMFGGAASGELGGAPDEALAVVAWAGSDALAEPYAGSKLAMLAGRSAWSELPGQLRKSWSETAIRTGIDPQFRRLVDRGLDLFGPLSKRGGTAWGMPAGDDGSPPVVVLRLEPGDPAAGEQFRASLDELFAALPRDAAPLRAEVHAMPDGSVAVVWNGSVDDAVVAGSSWAQRPAWSRITGGFDGPAALAVGLNVKAIFRETEAATFRAGLWRNTRADKAGIMNTLRSLGLDGAGDLVWANGFDGRGGWSNRMFLEAPAPRAGLLSLLDHAQLEQDAWASVPGDAEVVSMLALDVGTAVDELKRVVLSFAEWASDEPGFEEDMEQGLRSAEAVLGLDVEADLIDRLGTTWTLTMDPMAGGQGFLGIVLSSPLPEPEPVMFSLDKLARTGNGALRMGFTAAEMPWIQMGLMSERIDGVRLTRLGTPAVSPTWTVHDGQLLIGLQPESVVATVQRRRGEIMPMPLEGNGSPEALLNSELLRDGRIVYASMINLPETAPQSQAVNLIGGRLLTGTVEMISGRPMPRLLPTLPEVMPLLERSWTIGVVSEDGLALDSSTPFPAATLYGPGGGGEMQIVGMIISAVAEAGEAARQAGRRADDPGYDQPGEARPPEQEPPTRRVPY